MSEANRVGRPTQTEGTKENAMKERLYDILVEQDGQQRTAEIDLPLDKATRLLAEYRQNGWKATIAERIYDDSGNFVITR